MNEKALAVENKKDLKPLGLVILPGLDGTGILLQPFVAALPENIRPIVVRYPSDRHLTYEQLLPLIRDAIPPAEPFILLGESFSGPLAIRIAAERPGNLVGLILCASFVTPPIWWLSPVVPLLARSLPFYCYPIIQRLKIKLRGQSTTELEKLFAQAHELLSARVIAARVRMVFRVDVRQELRSFNVPILYLAGLKDRVVPARNLRLIRQIRPDTRSVTLDGPHMLLQVLPAESAKAVCDFASSMP